MIITLVLFFIWSGVLLLGLLFGSFVTMASYRIPRGEEIIVRRSHCVACNHNLSFSDLVPVFSWLVHKGKCAYCGIAISKRYPIIELAVGVLFLPIYAVYGISPLGVVLALTSVCLMIIIVTDFEHYIIPDKIYPVLLPLALIYSRLHQTSWLTILAGGLICLSLGLVLRWLMRIWKKQEGLGLGDVKFLGIVGCFLGPALLAPFFFLSGIIGIVTGLVWQALGRGKLFPFGPALAVSLFICLFIPDSTVLFDQLRQLFM
jgi:prepilin signal peptidase PulO-like enzyme (type II secretory pathway)